jgi:hypothetical protein
VFFHCPPCDIAQIPGETDLPYPDHPGPPLWVPVQNHGIFLSHRCNCQICRERSSNNPENMVSRHIWAFTVSDIIDLSGIIPMDPKDLLLRVADWVFIHSSERRRPEIRPNQFGPNLWTLFPVDVYGHNAYKTWFYYNAPADPLFEGRPTIYIPPNVLQLRQGGF